ncbi:acyltransferase [Paenibacillus sp.]|uniref:acyltransferase family protein n=1 Tax=Paenibacillus sp. TaxID=58172 RepID=UPI002D26EE5F|nr:acyltransferase [Paenibacillus sp.]HZG86045.1 acyltransferase [Paenibacillus sp.]
MRTHLAGADGLRAIACLAVIGHHFSQRLAMPQQPAWLQELQAFALLGNVGVSVFFVLSGFLLSYPFWRSYVENEAYPSLRAYALRRAARIIPGYYVSLLFCAAVAAAMNIPVEAFWTRLIAGLTFTAGFHYTTFFPSELNGPLWSISFEVFCYLLMPLFMWGLFRAFGRRRSFRTAFLYWGGALTFVFIANQGVHAWLTPEEEGRGWQHGLIGGAKYWMPNYNPIGFFGHFALGILSAGAAIRLGRQTTERMRLFRDRGGMDWIAGGALLAAGALLWLLRREPEFSFSLQQQPYYFPLFPGLVALFLAAAPHSKRVGGFLDNAFFRFTAKLSFGLYIWHYTLITLVERYAMTDYRYMGVVEWHTWLEVSLALLGVSYAVAAVSFYALEQPCIRIARRWEHRMRPFRKDSTENAMMRTSTKESAQG